MAKGGMSVDQYIEHLLCLGKKLDAPEFQILFEIYGRERISKTAEEILKKYANEMQLNTWMERE